MGGSKSKPAKIMHYSPEEGKNGTPPFRAIECPLDQPLASEGPGHLDTMLKCFEYIAWIS